MKAESLKEKLLKGSIWVFAGKFVTGIAQILIAMLLARMLTTEDFGAFQVLQRLLILLALVGSFSMGWLAVRRMAESLDDASKESGLLQAKSIFFIVAVVSTLFSVVLFFAGDGLVASAFQINIQPYIYILSGLVILVSFQQVIPETFRGLHDLKLASVFSGAATNTLMLLSFAILLLFGIGMNVSSVLLTYLLCSLLVLGCSGSMLVRRLSTAFHTVESNDLSSRDRFMGNIKIGFPLTVSGIISFVVQQADVWIVAAFFGIEQAAYYGAASRLIFLIAAPVMVANGATRGMIAKLWVSGEKERLEKLMRTVATLTFLAAILPALVFLFWSEPIMVTLFGGEYQQGAIVLVVLVFGQLALLASGPAGTLMVLAGYQNISLLLDLFGAGVFLLLAWVLGVNFGMSGIAGASSIALALRAMMAMLFVQYKLDIRTFLGRPSFSRLMK